MLNAKVRSGWDRLMRPLGRALGRSRVSPNAITLAGLALHGPVAWLILEGRFTAAGLLAVPVAFFDSFDGAVAKARGITSRFGALLDSSTDRIADALLLIPIAWLYGVSPDVAERSEPWVAATALTALVFSFQISYVKARAEGLGFDCNVGLMERAERLIVVILALVFDIVPVGVVVLAIGSAITYLQRVLHVYKQAKAGG